MSQEPRTPQKSITIHDLAKLLNVSASTVSRALNNHSSISAKTTIRVKEMARDMGFRPNRLAANLRNQKTSNIGIIVTWINQPFLSSLISGAEAEARERGYSVIISQSHDSYETEVAHTEALFDSQVCAIIVSLAMESKNYDHFDTFIKTGTPVVFVDRVPTTINCHKVVIDNFEAGFKATNHLISQGCTRIAHLGGQPTNNVYKDRLEGYLEALRQNNLTIDQDLIFEGKFFNSEEGFRFAHQVLGMKNRPDGIFSVNDKIAVSVIQHAKKIGLDIPNDLAVIGFNDDPVCQIIEPPLSTVSNPGIEMGRATVRQAIAIIEGNNDLSRSSEIDILPTELVLRASSQRCGGK